MGFDREIAFLLEKWVNINTHTENLVGIETLLKEVKGAFQVLNPDKMEEVDLSHNRKGLFLKKRGKAPFQIFFGGHLDTVFSKTHPFQKASYVDEEKLNGPGAADMKGGIVVLLKTLERFEKTEQRQKIGWEIFLNSDEEIGSPDSTPFMEQCAERCHFACLFEPRLEDGSFVSKRKGSSNFTLFSRGKRAHAGRDFTQGKNAIYPLIHFLSEIESLSMPAKGILINVGVIKGGEATNIVPDYAECHLNLRADDLQTMASTEERLKLIAQKQGLTLVRTSWRPPKIFDEKTEKYFQKLKSCGSQLGMAITWKETGGVCDGNTFAAKGVPVIDTLGVRGGKIHTSEEFVHLASLSEQIELMLVFLGEIAKEVK